MVTPEHDGRRREDRPQLPTAGGRLDILRLPVLGRFLRWPGSRLAFQIPTFLLSLVLILHAFFGPERAPKNLATLVTWVHFRGFIVLALLVIGNIFCMACPFLLPREFARRLIVPRRQIPRWLRNKVPATILFVTVLYTYELFDLWGDPFWTGVMIVTYFVGAMIVDVMFKGAPFCKYFCPVGQFNFLGSTLSPFEVTVRDPGVCGSCVTNDCISGRRGPRPGLAPSSEGSKTSRQPIVQRGCELALFQPLKVGNLDCTFCLDCVYACPHENVGMLSRVPGKSLAIEGFRSGIGSIERRADWNFLIIVFVFGGLLNAFAMTPPVYKFELAVAEAIGITLEWPILGMLFFVMILIVPLICLNVAARVSCFLSGIGDAPEVVMDRFVRSLVPFGFGVWLAHYGFHFFTGALTVIPVMQNAVLELMGSPVFGEPLWHLGGLSAEVVFPLELGLLSLGFMGSLYVGSRIAALVAPGRAFRAGLPWGAFLLVLFGISIWILLQPMDMRGTFLG